MKKHLIYYSPVNRRMFLRGIGGLFAVPFLSSLLPRQVRAQASSPIRRLINIGVPDQFPPMFFSPNGYGGLNVDPRLSALVSNRSEGPYDYKVVDLVALAAQDNTKGVCQALGPRFNSYLNKIAIYRGLDFPGRIDHGNAAAFGNIAGSHMGHNDHLDPCLTIDQVLARSAEFYGHFGASDNCPGPILHMGESSISTAFFNKAKGQGVGLSNGSNSGLSYNGNILQAFEALFTPRVPLSPTRTRIVDSVQESVRELMRSRKLGSEDKKSLQEFLGGSEALESCLRNAPPPLPQRPVLDPSPENISTNGAGRTILGAGSDPGNVERYYSSLAEFITMAIRLDLVRIFNVGFNSSVVRIDNFNRPTSHTESSGWHGVYGHKHDYPKLLEAHQWILNNFVLRIMENLQGAVGSDGKTLLDQTTIYYAPEMSFGHSGINVGGLLIGGDGINGGKLYDYADYLRGTIDYTSYTSSAAPPGEGRIVLAPGQPINRLWATILDSMGLAPADYLNKANYGTGSFYSVWNSNYPKGFESDFSGVSRSSFIAYPLLGLSRSRS